MKNAPFNPMDDDERLSYWSNLLEGKVITSVIIKDDKSTFSEGGAKKEHPGVIGIVIEGVGPVYIVNGAFGDSFGTFEVFYDMDCGKIIPHPDQEKRDGC